MKPHLLRFGRILLPMVLASGFGFSAAQAQAVSCAKIHDVNFRVAETERHRQLMNENFSPYYEKEWNRLSGVYRAPFWEIKQQGSREIEVLEKLGFQVHQESINIVGFSEFQRNYEYLLSDLKIPENAKLKPSLTFENAVTKDMMLVTPGKDGWPSASVTTVDDFISAIQKLPREEIRRRANFWIENYNKYLTPYASAMAEPVEYTNYRNRIRFGYEWRSHLDGYYSTTRPVLPDGLIYDSLAYRPEFLRRLVQHEQFMEDGQVQMMIARMEYALWKTSRDITIEKWAADTLTKDFNPESETVQLIRDVYGENSPIYRLFLGPG